MMYNETVRKPMKMVLDHVELDGLIKLIAKEPSTVIALITPDARKMSKEEWKQYTKGTDEKWGLDHRGPYPGHFQMSDVWMPQKLATKEGESPRVLQAYTPVDFAMPVADVTEETYRELKERIERESFRAVKYVRGNDAKGRVNAFYIGNLRQDYVIPEGIKECMPIAGDSFLDRQARDVLIPRVVFDLCLFEIEKDVKR